MAPETRTETPTEDLDDVNLEATLHEIRAFLDDPIALLERALSLITAADAV